jgi:hypothetical protein
VPRDSAQPSARKAAPIGPLPVKYSSAWVTSLPVGRANVADLAAAGRARWKIENETFNVMKNHRHGAVKVTIR